MEDSSIYDDPQRLFAAMTQGNPNIPTPGFPTFSKVKKETKQRVTSIFADHDALLCILERYEDVLQKRWMKKSSQQRRKLLLEVCPNMPNTHRPDFDGVRKEPTRRDRNTPGFYDKFLLPSINLEDMVQPKNLLLFLQSRGYNKPDVFVNSDFNSIHVGQISKVVVPSYISGYSMLLKGQHSVDTYGSLISWDEDPDAFNMMSKGIAMQPGEGLVVLEIQERKLSFLLECAKHILHDLPLDDNNVPKLMTAAPKILPGEDSEWSSLIKEVLEAPYKVPDQFDLARLQSFVFAKRAEAEDHIWFLREDPSYFGDHVYQWSEHRQEKLPTINGKLHPILRRDDFWERVLSNVVVEAYGGFLMWDQMGKEVRNLVTLRSEFADQLASIGDLPEQLNDALAHFSHFLEQATKGPLALWKVGMVASPPLRGHFVREPQDPDNPNKIRVQRRGNAFHDEDYFLWLLERLTLEDQIFLCGLENILDEIERLIRGDQKNLKRLSPWLADVLSNLCLLAELKRQHGLLYPGPPMEVSVDQAELQADFSSKTRLVSKVFDILTKGMKLATAGTPLSNFNYPSGKRRTATVVRQMQEAENNLDLFWKQVDDHVFSQSGQSLHQLLAGVLNDHESVLRFELTTPQSDST